MGFEVGAVDHQSVRRARLAREPCEDAVAEGLVRAVGGRRVAPAQAVADNEDDAADNAGNAAGKWEEGLDPPHLGGRAQVTISHGGTSAMG